MDNTKTEIESELYDKLLNQLRCDLIEMTQKLFMLPLLIPQVAQILGCSYSSLYKKIQKGYVDGHIINGGHCMSLNDVIQCYDSLCEHTGRKARRKKNVEV